MRNVDFSSQSHIEIGVSANSLTIFFMVESGGGGFFLACEDLGRRFIPRLRFFFFFYQLKYTYLNKSMQEEDMK